MEHRPLLSLARVLALIGGLSAAFIGVLLGALFTLSSLLQGQEALVSGVTFGFSIVVVTVCLGLAVAWQAIQAIQGRPSRPFQPSHAWPLVILFLLALAVGQTILSLDLLPVAAFPLFHVLAASLPPLIILGLAGRALPGITRWREVILQLGAGALLATPLAFSLEAILLLVLGLMAMFSVALRPGGPELLERLGQWLQTAPPLENPEALLPLLLSPTIIAGIMAIVAGAVPLLEEAVKAIGVPLLAYRRPSRTRALLWGLSGGAGFALVEGLLNSAAGLQAWAMVVVVRLGATLLHCLTGALMGLAWYQGLRRRWWQALGLYAGSVVIHGLWNVLSVGVAFSSVSTPGPTSSALSLGLMAMLAGAGLALALALAGLVYSVRGRHPLAGTAQRRPSPTLRGEAWPQPASETMPGDQKDPPRAASGPHERQEHRSKPVQGGEFKS